MVDQSTPITADTTPAASAAATAPSDEAIMYGDAGAPQPEVAPPPAPEALWVPLELDDVAPERLDVVYQGRTYEMLGLTEIGTVSQKILFKYWRRKFALAAKVRDLAPGQEDNPALWADLDEGDDSVDPQDDAMLDKCNEMMIRCFLPSMPRAIIQQMRPDQRERLVGRFLAFIVAPTGGSTGTTTDTVSQPTGATSSPASPASTPAAAPVTG